MEMSISDHLCMRFDQGLRALFASTSHTTRPNPAHKTPAASSLTAHEAQQAAALMRVNHAGEICAQALYQGQAITARSQDVKAHLQQAAREECDHLAWCQERITELGGYTSYLRPLWQLGATAIGMMAGLAGDAWSLGFIAETERQVVEHLDSHLANLPRHDEKSRAILKQMQAEEKTHGSRAIEAGAKELPHTVKVIMHYTAKIMTSSAYYV